MIQKETSDEKANEFQTSVETKYNKYFPEKVLKIANDDQPWITHRLKTLDRKRKRVYQTERSYKWKSVDKLFKTEIKSAILCFTNRWLLISKRKTRTNGIQQLKD